MRSERSVYAKSMKREERHKEDETGTRVNEYLIKYWRECGVRGADEEMANICRGASATEAWDSLRAKSPRLYHRLIDIRKI